MNRFIHIIRLAAGCLFLLAFWSMPAPAQIADPVIGGVEPFITTWKTDNPGASDDDQITVPTFPDETYNYDVDWGDGNTDTGVTGDITHTYDDPGIYTVEFTGDFPRIFFNNGGDREKILTVEQWGDIAWSSMEFAFFGTSNLQVNATDAPDLSGVTSMTGMFAGASSLNADIGHWNVSSITDMFGLFADAPAFNGDIGDWDVSNVTNMQQMFAHTSPNLSTFDQNIGDWNVSNVTNMLAMFQHAGQFNQDIGDWDVSNVTLMVGMFAGAVLFNQDIGGWDVSSVMAMNVMFAEATSFNQDIRNWDVSNVITMPLMFASANAFNQDIGGWNVSNVTDMLAMLDNSGLSVANYDATLLGWAGQPLQEDVLLGVDGLVYCSAVDARQWLIDNNNWGIFGDEIEDEECEGEGPIADISPEFFELEVAQGDSADDTLSIGNTGTADLIWNINETESDSGCETPVDIPWLTASPTAGTTPAGGTSDVTVMVNASGLPQGDYEALLCVTSDAPFNGLIPVPVTLEVTDPDAGALEGAVTSAGHCGVDPHPVADVLVAIVGQDNTFEVMTDGDGFYTIDINENESPVDITVNTGDYLDGTVTGVEIQAGQTTAQDFDLVLDAPCATVDPGGFAFELSQGSTGTRVLAVGNVDGVAALGWEMLESVGSAPQSSGQVIWHQSTLEASGGDEPARGGGLIWDQDINGKNGIISDFGNTQNAGVYVADDFLIGPDQFIAEIFTPGFVNNDGSLATDATEITWIIYPDDGGVPAGHPEDGGGNEAWMLTVPIGDPALDITDEEITLDVVAAQDVSIALGAGRFWLVVFPSVNVADITAVDSKRWNWAQGEPQEELSKLIDPQGLFGGVAPDWSNFADVGVGWTDMAFTLTGGPPPPDCWDPAINEWLDVVPGAGTADAGATQAVDVIADTSGLAPGDFETTLCLHTNDPNAELTFIPVTLTVLDQEPSELAVAPSELNFGDVVIGASGTLSFTVSNAAAPGAGDLELSVIDPGGNAVFSITGGDCTPGAILAPQQSCTVEVGFAPGNQGSFGGTVDIATAGEQAASVVLTGSAFDPGEEIFRDRFEEDL